MAVHLCGMMICRIEAKCLEEVNLPQCHFIYHKYHIYYPGSIPYHRNKNLTTEPLSYGKSIAGYVFIATLRTPRHFRIVNVKNTKRSESTYIFNKNADHKVTY
jgi:uncharacterized protein (UPF0248 family)